MKNKVFKLLLVLLMTALIATMLPSNSPVKVNAAGSKVYQAKNAKYGKGAVKSKIGKGWTSGGYAKLPKKKRNASVTFLVKSASNTYSNVILRYSNGNKKAVGIKILANGKHLKTKSYQRTGWNKWATSVDTIKLKKGTNKITYRNTGLTEFRIDKVSVNTLPNYTILVDENVKYQTIDGFGGFAGNDASDTFTTSEFENNIVNDLGATIFRAEVPTDFQLNDYTIDPNGIDLSRYNVNGAVRKWLDHFKSLKEIGGQKFFASVWSPPAWMKTNNHVNNGGHLKKDMYQKFGEYCAAYVMTVKKECGIDLYGFSIQNEPVFAEPYQSCEYTPAEYASAMSAVAKEFKKQGIKTKILGPEDLDSINRIKDFIYAMEDSKSVGNLGIMAVHGYGSDGINPGAMSIPFWQGMYNFSKEYKKPLWMTETSGYKNIWNTITSPEDPGAIHLAYDMYVALKHGKLNAWVWWRLSDNANPRNEMEGLMKNMVPTTKYYVSKNYYKYIRPGSVQIKSISNDSKIAVLTFKHTGLKQYVTVLINIGTSDKTITIGGMNGSRVPKLYQNAYRTSATENCVELGQLSESSIVLPGNSITTLVSSYDTAK